MIIPATGSQISFGCVNKAFTNYAAGAVGNAPLGGTNIKLSGILAFCSVYGINRATATTQVDFSATFGGRPHPYAY